MSKMNAARWALLQDFALDNKDLLIMLAVPETDEILVAFNGRTAFVKFPMQSKEEGVVFNALRKSRFNEAIDPLMTGLIEATGLSETEGNQLYQVLGGSIKALGQESKRSSLEVFNEESNGKKSKKGGRA